MSDEREVVIPDDEYDQGYIAGLRCYAWWKDGEQFVGTGGTTLKQAIAERQDGWNYGD